MRQTVPSRQNFGIFGVKGKVMYCEVKKDLFDLARRLKTINRGYRIYFNNREVRYEVHTLTSGKPSARSLAFVVPYEKLDSRIIDYANKSKRENDSVIEREVNEANESTQRKIFENIKDRQRDLEDMLAYASRVNRRVDFTKNFTKEF
jgi:hypothetical protein